MSLFDFSNKRLRDEFFQLESALAGVANAALLEPRLRFNRKAPLTALGPIDIHRIQIMSIHPAKAAGLWFRFVCHDAFDFVRITLLVHKELPDTDGVLNASRDRRPVLSRPRHSIN